MLFYCRQNKITQHQKRVTIFALFSFSFVCLFCFSSVNIFKVKLVVSFCNLSVISDSCEPCLGGGGGYQYPVSLKQNRQISHIPKIYFRSKAKNIPKNTQNDNAISHIPSNSEDTYTISLKIKWQISRIPIYHIQGSVVGRYSTYFVTKDTKSLSKYKTTIFTRCLIL